MSEPTLEDLKRYVEGLTPEQRAIESQKGQRHDNAVFDLVKSGDRVGLYCSVKHNPSLLTRQDDNHMTPLHYAAGDKSGLIQEILTETPNTAPWVRDKFNRLPLDVTREAKQHKIANQVERLTYPNHFKQIEEESNKLAKLKQFAEQEKAFGRAETAPQVARSKESIKPTKERLKDKELSKGR